MAVLPLLVLFLIFNGVIGLSVVKFLSRRKEFDGNTVIVKRQVSKVREKVQWENQKLLKRIL